MLNNVNNKHDFWLNLYLKTKSHAIYNQLIWDIVIQEMFFEKDHNEVKEYYFYNY